MKLKFAVKTLQRRRHYLLAEVAKASYADSNSANYDKMEIAAIEAVLAELELPIGAMPDPKKYKSNRYYEKLDEEIANGKRS